MRIGIIVYSKTGNTRLVADRLKDELENAGHSVTIDPVVPEGEVKSGQRDIRFKNEPELTGYEGIILASPVQGFSLAPAMKAYIDRIASTDTIKIASFVTKHLKSTWTGGNRALRTMRRGIKKKGGLVQEEAIIPWSVENREEKIFQAVQKLTEIFKS